MKLSVKKSLGIASLVLALTAAPVLAGGGPRFSLSPGRGASGTEVTMAMKNCADPRLWAGSANDGAAAAFGAEGYVQFANLTTGARGYLYAGIWGGSATTWTTTFHADLPSGKNNIFAWCGPNNMLRANFTVR